MSCQIRVIDTCLCPYMACLFLINIIKLRLKNVGDVFTRILNVLQDPPVSSLFHLQYLKKQHGTIIPKACDRMWNVPY